MIYNPLDGNKFIQHFSENVGMGVFVYDQALRLVEWNRYMEACTGLKKADSLGKKLHEVFPQQQETDKHLYERALAGESFTQDAIHIQGNYSTKFITLHDLHYFPLEDAAHKIKWGMVLVTSADVDNDFTQPENLLYASRATIEDFLKFAPFPVFIVDARLNIKLANKAFYEFSDADPKKVRNVRDIVPLHLLDHLQAHVEGVIQSKQPLLLKEDYHLNRGKLHVHTILFPVRNQQGIIDSIGGYFIDLTKEVEQQQQNKLLLDETLRLNEMLNKQNLKLKQKRVQLDEANKVLKDQKEELQHVVDELSDRNYELDQIMYKTSHDLRAPLISILGLLQVARQESNPDKLHEYHDYIENRILKLDNFVKTMLTYAKSSRSDIALDIIDWQLLVQEALEHVHYLEHYSKIRHETTFNTDIYTFQSDPVRVAIILNNLVGNAIKYADLRKADPFVIVRTYNTEKGATIEVEDNGIGIPQQYIDKVWDMFFRATDRSEGSGLGLYIVKQTVERLKGTLHVDSQEGKGTTVVVFLPHLTKQQRLKTVRPNNHSHKKDI